MPEQTGRFWRVAAISTFTWFAIAAALLTLLHWVFRWGVRLLWKESELILGRDFGWKFVWVWAVGLGIIIFGWSVYGFSKWKPEAIVLGAGMSAVWTVLVATVHLFVAIVFAALTMVGRAL